MSIFVGSPDGVAVIQNDISDANVWSAEIKPMAALVTIHNAERTREKYGSVVGLNSVVGWKDTLRVFRDVFTTTQYILQCFDHFTVPKKAGVLLVIAKGSEMRLGNILHSVLVDFHESPNANYNFSLESLRYS